MTNLSAYNQALNKAMPWVNKLYQSSDDSHIVFCETCGKEFDRREGSYYSGNGEAYYICPACE